MLYFALLLKSWCIFVQQFIETILKCVFIYLFINLWLELNLIESSRQTKSNIGGILKRLNEKCMWLPTKKVSTGHLNWFSHALSIEFATLSLDTSVNSVSAAN